MSARASSAGDSGATQLHGHCLLLDWDTQFFGVRIARASTDRLETGSVAAMLGWCRAQAVACLYLLADAAHAPTTRLAEENRFSLVDIRMSLLGDLSRAPAGEPEPRAELGPVQPSEVEALRALAAVSHRDSRFYFDPGFERAACDKLYATWMDKCCSDPAGTVLVARREGQIAGYLACQQQDDFTGRIVLIAVAAAYQRQHVGYALLAAGLHWFRQRKLRSVSVVTQGRNVAAQRLYQRFGFVTENVQLWYHRWFPSP
jgi:dTDP-4-amino-4,6-dideoxy-D-galactose acyltransferase